MIHWLLKEMELNIKTKMVLQKNISGEIIQKFNSATQASKQLHLKRSAIVNCCKGKQKTLKGNIFELV